MSKQYDFQNKVEIGRGAFGRVYKVKDKRNNRFVAIKALSNFQSTKDEIKLLKQCKSPFIVEFIGVIQTEFSTLIVMEYCAKGSLMNILKTRNAMNEIEIHKVIKHVLYGLDFLHNKTHILHRDIKPDNILIGNDLNYKLSDFGVSKDVEISTAKTKCGTPLYMAPELLQFKKYDSKCDIYSVGVTAIHLFIYSDPNIMKDIKSIQKLKKNINLLQTKNDNFKNFIKKCIVTNSTKRASVQQLLTMDAFINDDEKSNDSLNSFKKTKKQTIKQKYDNNSWSNSPSKQKQKKKYHPKPLEYFHPDNKPKIISYHPGTKRMRHSQGTDHPSPLEKYHPGSINYVNGNDHLDICDHEGFNYQKAWAQWTCCQHRVWRHDRINKRMVLTEGCSCRRDCCGVWGVDYYNGCIWKCCGKKKDDNNGCQLRFDCCDNSKSNGCKTKKMYSCCNNNDSGGCQQRYLCCGNLKDSDGCCS